MSQPAKSASMISRSTLRSIPVNRWDYPPGVHSQRRSLHSLDSQEASGQLSKLLALPKQCGQSILGLLDRFKRSTRPSRHGE